MLFFRMKSAQPSTAISPRHVRLRVDDSPDWESDVDKVTE